VYAGGLEAWRCAVPALVGALYDGLAWGRQVLWLAADGGLAVWVHAVTTGSVPQPRTYHSADAFNGAHLRSRSPRRARHPYQCVAPEVAGASAVHMMLLMLGLQQAPARTCAAALSQEARARLPGKAVGGQPHGARARLTRASGARARAGGRSVVVFGGSFYWRSQTAVPVHVLDAGGLAWQCYVPPAAFCHSPDGLAAEPWMALPGNRMLHLTAVRGAALRARGARALGGGPRSVCDPAELAPALGAVFGGGLRGSARAHRRLPSCRQAYSGARLRSYFQARLNSPTCVVPSRLPQHRVRSRRGMAPHYIGTASDVPSALVGRGEATAVLSRRCCWAAAAAAAAAADIMYR